ncbi:MAG: circadian clock protein KaiC [Candidatus Eisenbacteria bacterium]|nr:circadian clock protein KaiC [Candidatus Eisenbacteria bacterium]
MKSTSAATAPRSPGLAKVSSGIPGLDDITDGGLPKGRSTLVCGGAGSGKTLFAIEFLVHGARRFDEPGVLMAFDETANDLIQNVASLGFGLPDLIRRKKFLIDFVRVEAAEILETGEYDLEGLFVRLGHAIDSIGAKRVALDSLETLFAGLSNTAILRSELRRLFRWMKDRGVTSVITAERGEGTLTRHGLEEYISDCVVLLDHRVHNQVATRRLRIVKYRGSHHGADEFPFLIGDHGLVVLPITSLGLTHVAGTERVSSGVPRLDQMLGGKGYFRGSSILVSGTAGTGKTSFSAHLVDAACRRGERSLIFLFEESPSQLIRNMQSIGVDLSRWVEMDRLRIYAARPTLHGLETHLATMHQVTAEFQPHVVAVDPVTNLAAAGTLQEAKSLLIRLIDHFKERQITAFFTSLTHGEQHEESTDIGISSLMDTWLLIRELETNGERNRVLYLLKSRGMSHSNQVREFRLTDNGIDLIDVYVGPGGVLTGTARLAQEARDRAEELDRRQAFLKRKHDLDQRRQALQSQLGALQLEHRSIEEELQTTLAQESAWFDTQRANRIDLARVRQADPARMPMNGNESPAGRARPTRGSGKSKKGAGQ